MKCSGLLGHHWNKYLLIENLVLPIRERSPCVNKEPKNFEKPEDVLGLSARRVLRLFIRRIMPRICHLNQSMPHIDGLCEGSRHNRFR